MAAQAALDEGGRSSTSETLAAPAFRLKSGLTLEPANAAARRLMAERPDVFATLADAEGRMKGELRWRHELARAKGRPCCTRVVLPDGRETAVLFLPPPPGFVILPELDAWGDPVPLLRDIGLTRREAELSVLLARGCDLAAAARRLGISEGTARNHLKQAFAKTGLHGQAQLVGLVARLAVLAGHAERDPSEGRGHEEGRCRA